MLSKRPELSSLLAGVLIGGASLIVTSPDIVFAVIMACSTALLCLSHASEKKVLIFIAGGASVGLIGFTFIALDSIINELAVSVAIAAITYYLSDAACK